MDWLSLLLLAHLVMIPFCLKGMLNKRKELNEAYAQRSHSSSQFQDLQIQMEKLTEQNRNIQRAIMSLKEDELKTKDSSNIIEFNKQSKKKGMGIS